MTTALFVNGVYDGVLTEILCAQEERGGGDSYLQPHKGQVIDMLRKQKPSPESPIRLYASTTNNLSYICYTALIVGWEDKREISQRRRAAIRRHLEQYQPEEIDLFTSAQKAGEKAVNLITIRNLQHLDTFHASALLRKVSDDLPLKKRTRSGGWSEVYDLGDFVNLPSDTREQYNEDLEKAVAMSSTLSDAALRKRLSTAPKLPEKVQIVSVGYRRNPDVIVSVLRRAGGRCERCKTEAPFLRRSDGSPYLEVHHGVPLCQGGEDTTENATALCPNCHREVHHGQMSSEKDISASQDNL